MYLQAVNRVIAFEWKKYTSTAASVFQSVFYPIIYLFVAAPAIGSQVGDIMLDGQPIPYMYYVLPGVIIFNAFSSSQYVGINQYISIVTGEMEMLISFPFKRAALIQGTISFALIKSIIQASIFLLVTQLFYASQPIGIRIWLIYMAMITLFSLVASSIFFALACLIRSQNAFNIMVNMITLPLIVTSNGLYSLENAPLYLRILTRINPLSYYIQAMRQAAFSREWSLFIGVSIVSLALLPVLLGLAIHKINSILD